MAMPAGTDTVPPWPVTAVAVSAARLSAVATQGSGKAASGRSRFANSSAMRCSTAERVASTTLIHQQRHRRGIGHLQNHAHIELLMEPAASSGL